MSMINRVLGVASTMDHLDRFVQVMMMRVVQVVVVVMVWVDV